MSAAIRHTLGNVLDVDDLAVSLPVGGGWLEAVRGVSFSIARGETFAIVGESGCGKSTAALALLGLLPRGGIRRVNKLLLCGDDLTGLSTKQLSQIRGNRIAMIFQDPMTSLDPAFTIGDQLSEVLVRHKGMDKSSAMREVVRSLDLVRFPSAQSRIRQYPHQLSGGLRQRVMIAMALLCSPDLIVADEPTTALDVTIQAQILRLLQELRDELGLSLILISHDLGVVAHVADRVAVMYAGQFVETAPPKTLFDRPEHPYTRGLLSCLPVPGVTARQTHLGVISGTVPSLRGRMIGCAFANRCPQREEACTRAPVELVAQGEDHSVRCVVACRNNVGALAE